jgi:hypothetical protein
LALLSVATLHKFCLYSGVLGAAVYFSAGYLLSRHDRARKTGAERRRAG